MEDQLNYYLKPPINNDWSFNRVERSGAQSKEIVCMEKLFMVKDTKENNLYYFIISFSKQKRKP